MHSLERTQAVRIKCLAGGERLANQRGVLGVDRNVRDDGATRWRMQLGARYRF